jgi:hypothetical protein
VTFSFEYDGGMTEGVEFDESWIYDFVFGEDFTAYLKVIDADNIDVQCTVSI